MTILSSDELPLELLYPILLGTITTSIHSIGIGHGTKWDVNVFTTLANVSSRFEAVAGKLAGDIFGDQGGERSVNDAESLMHELHLLCQPEGWCGVAVKYAEKYPSNIFHAYAVLTSAVSTRRAVVNNSIPAFLASHELTKNALTEISSCWIATPELASAFELRYSREMELLTASITLVRTCDQINSLLPAPPGHLHMVPEEELIRFEELSKLLFIIEAATIKYDYARLRIGEPQNARVIQLPGVGDAIRKLRHFNSPLAGPITSILSRWRIICPVLVGPLSLDITQAS